MKHKAMFVAALMFLWGTGTAWAQERTEIHFPDPPGYHTLKCDFHMHTVFSDGSVWPTVRVDEAWREGLDAIAITDHIEYQPHREDIPTKHNRPYELAAGKAKERGILLVRGAEISRATPPGHFNAILLSNIDPLDTKDFYEVFRQAQRQHAFVFWNHPGWKGPELGRWGEEQTQLLKDGQLHGIEICNGHKYYVEAHQSAMEHGLTLVGNSDLHGASSDAKRTPENHRTLTLVLATENTVPALREALVAGRTAVWCQNQLIGSQKVLAALFAACVEVKVPHYRSGETVWVRIHNRSELDIELKRLGKGRPGRISLLARATSLVRFNDTAPEQNKGRQYRALNFLIGPNRPLTVSLDIPQMPEQPTAGGSFGVKSPVAASQLTH